MMVRRITGGVEVLQWYAIRLRPPKGGHRRTTMVGGQMRDVKRRSGHVTKQRKPGTGKRVFVAEHILKAKGFAVFLPVKMHWRRKHRFTQEQELISVPIMADWMFVGWPLGQSRWRELSELNVVSGVMGTGGRPVQIKPEVVAKLMSRWGDGVPPAVRRVANAAAQLVVGDQVSIADGPFEDFKGTVLDVDDDCATVAANIFGRETPVQVRGQDLILDRPVLRRSAGTDSEGRPACFVCGSGMAYKYTKARQHHLCCSNCGAVGPSHSDSVYSALEGWERAVTERGPSKGKQKKHLTG